MYSIHMKAAYYDPLLPFCPVFSERKHEKSFCKDGCAHSFICLDEMGASGHMAFEI